MKQGLTLTQLATEIERRANAKKDYVAPVGKLAFTVPVDETEPHLQVIGKQSSDAFRINGLAHGQIAEYTGIPKPYYDRMKAADPQLLATNVNRWMGDRSDARNAVVDDRRMVRTMDGTVRAFLSDRYRPLENEDLAEAILPVLLDMDLLIVSSEITDRRLYIKAVHRSIELDVPSGKKMGDASHTFFDTIVPAISISNSEVGAGRLAIETGALTKMCTNLAWIGTGFKKQHVGGRAEISDDVYALLTDRTKALTDAAVWGQVRDVVKGAFDAVQFQKVAEKLGAAAEDKIDGDVVEIISRFSKRNALGDGLEGSILRHLIEGADLTRYGLHSAITRASADVEDYDAATDLERLGGQVIELPRQAWKELLAA